MEKSSWIHHKPVFGRGFWPREYLRDPIRAWTRPMDTILAAINSTWSYVDATSRFGHHLCQLFNPHNPAGDEPALREPTLSVAGEPRSKSKENKHIDLQSPKSWLPLGEHSWLMVFPSHIFQTKTRLREPICLPMFHILTLIFHQLTFEAKNVAQLSTGLPCEVGHQHGQTFSGQHLFSPSTGRRESKILQVAAPSSNKSVQM